MNSVINTLGYDINTLISSLIDFEFMNIGKRNTKKSRQYGKRTHDRKGANTEIRDTGKAG